MLETSVRARKAERGRAVRLLLRGAAPLLLMTVTGCYSYVSIPPEAAAPGAQVRAQLANGEGSVPSRGLGIGRADLMEGEVVERRAESLVLSVFPRDLGVQTWSHGPRDTVAIRLNEIAALEQKQFSTVRTAGLVAGVAVVGALAIRYLFGDWSGATTRPPTGGPAEVLMPR